MCHIVASGQGNQGRGGYPPFSKDFHNISNSMGDIPPRNMTHLYLNYGHKGGHIAITVCVSLSETNQIREECRCAPCSSYWPWALHDSIKDCEILRFFFLNFTVGYHFMVASPPKRLSRYTADISLPYINQNNAMLTAPVMTAIYIGAILDRRRLT